MFRALKAKWHQATGAAAQSVGRAMPAWAVSLTVHVVLLVIISLLTFAVPNPFQLTLSVPDVTPIEELPEEFRFQETSSEDIGANSEDGLGVAMATAPELEVFEDLNQQEELEVVDNGEIQLVDDVEMATTPLNTSTKLVRGVAGVGVTGANGAIDRLTA